MNLSWHWLEAHVLTVVTAVLVVPFLARILRERRPQGSTLAWLLVVVVAPYIGIPLYLAIGQRKIARLGKQLYVEKEHAIVAVEPDVARLLCADGMRLPKPDNEVELIETGEAAFASIVALVEAAKSSIQISTFILGGDPAGNAIVERLAARAASGVKVHLLLDGLFSFRADRRKLAELRAAGGSVAIFSPMLHLRFRGYGNLRNHRKAAVFDGQIALVGGMNLAEEYMGPTPLPSRWCDLCARIRGPAVADIVDVFRADWKYATGKALEPNAEGDGPSMGSVRVQVVPSGPDSSADSFYEAILSACYAAKRRIWIATPYFVPDDALTRALCAASHRGLDVRVMVPLRSNHSLADLAGGPSLREVERAGGRVSTFPRMLHAKAVVIDESIGVVGSANFDMRSLFLNYELSVFFYSDEAIADLARWFESTERQCGRLGKAGAFRSLAEDIGRLLSPLV